MTHDSPVEFGHPRPAAKQETGIRFTCVSSSFPLAPPFPTLYLAEPTPDSKGEHVIQA